jgi:hypothetical protein
MPPHARTIRTGLCSLFFVLGAGGCYFPLAGDHARLSKPPVLPPEHAWPTPPWRLIDEALAASRDTIPLSAIQPTSDSPTPRTLASFSPPTGDELEPNPDGSFRIRSLSPEAQGRVALLRTSVGIVRVVVDPQGRPIVPAPTLLSLFRGFEPNAYVQSGLTFGSTLETVEALDRPNLLEDASTPRCIPTVISSKRAPLDEGIGILLPPAIPEYPRGVILHLWALASNPYEIEVIEHLRQSGWVVIDIDTLTSARIPLDHDAPERLLRIRAATRALNESLPDWKPGLTFDEVIARRRSMPEGTELARLEDAVADLRWPVLPLRNAEDADRAGAIAAGAIDLVLAQNAYAAEAALLALHEVHPSTRDLPLTIVAFSAGALSAPAAAARLRDRLASVVLVGGGANLMQIATESELTDGGIRLTDAQGRIDPHSTPRAARIHRPDPELRRLFLDRYLAYSRLDPFHTASALNGLPVLQIHAIWDTWVPAAAGELLTQRLGEPQRLLMPGGHGMLFYFLPERAPLIARWLDENTPRPGDARLSRRQ